MQKSLEKKKSEAESKVAWQEAPTRRRRAPKRKADIAVAKKTSTYADMGRSGKNMPNNEGAQRVASLLKTKPASAALTIKTSDSRTFTEVLTKVKNQTASSKWRLRQRERLMQFSKTTAPAKIADIRQEIATVIGEGTTVTSYSRRHMIQVNDIDPVTTQEEVLEALQGALPRSACKLVSLRAGFGGVQRAMVNCDDGPDARKLLTTSRLNIGFIL